MICGGRSPAASVRAFLSGSGSGFRLFLLILFGCCGRSHGFHFCPFSAFSAAGGLLFAFVLLCPFWGVFGVLRVLLSFILFLLGGCQVLPACIASILAVSGVPDPLRVFVPLLPFGAFLGLFALLCYRSRVRGFRRSSVRRSLGGCSSGAVLCFRVFAAAFYNLCPV